MQKLCANKRFVLLAGLMALALVALVGGSFVISTVYAANHSSLQDAAAQKSSAGQSGCDNKVLKCQRDASSPDTKGVFTIIDVNGNTIHAKVVESPAEVRTTGTIITTSKTLYTPDAGIVSAGTTVDVFGTANSDGSITATSIALPGNTSFQEGRITSVGGTSIIVQNKNLALTIHLTSDTTFKKIQLPSKESQPVSPGTLKVGQVIQAGGTLNSDGSLTASVVLIEE